MAGSDKKAETTCSFCGRSSKDVGQMVEAPNDLYICRNCVGHCLNIYEQEERRGLSFEFEGESDVDALKNALLKKIDAEIESSSKDSEGNEANGFSPGIFEAIKADRVQIEHVFSSSPTLEEAVPPLKVLAQELLETDRKLRDSVDASFRLNEKDRHIVGLAIGHYTICFILIITLFNSAYGLYYV